MESKRPPFKRPYRFVSSTSSDLPLSRAISSSESPMANNNAAEWVPGDDAQWPRACRYFDPLTMDPVKISALLTDDTEYISTRHRAHAKTSCLSFSRVVKGQASTYDSPLDQHKDGLFSQTTKDASLVVIHLMQKRLYLDRESINSIYVDADTWQQVLHQFEVLPTFLQLLHDNNGGAFSYTSHQTIDTPQRPNSVSGSSSLELPTAVHFAYKMGDWGNDEAAIYARYDIDSGHSFVLVTGTEAYLGVAQVRRLLQARPDANCFHVVQALHSVSLDMVETVRWRVDFNTQRLEAQTGIATLQQPDTEPLKPEELRFNKDLQVAVDFCRNLSWGSARLKINFEAFLKHLFQYETTCGIPTVTVQNIREACAFNIELARNQYDQIQCLQARLQSQVDVTRTLMAQRDTQLNIAIAAATKRDSELMKGIAAVTMIFLPATFVATFFSMVFFHVGDEVSLHFMVNTRIWMYPVVTVPLTVIVATWYLSWERGWNLMAHVQWRRRLVSNNEKSKSYS